MLLKRLKKFLIVMSVSLMLEPLLLAFNDIKMYQNMEILFYISLYVYHQENKAWAATGGDTP